MRKLNVFVKKPSLKPLVTNRKLADSMRAFIRISRWFAYFVIFSLTLSIWGAKFFSPFFVHLTYEKVILAAATFIVLLIASLLWGGITTLSNKHFSKLDLLSGEDRSHLFMKTITPIIRRFLHGLVVFLAVIVVLQMWGIDTTVLIYATSIISLAVSFGAQGLVKDIINGITALFDRKIAIGEVVTIGNHTGTVEEVHLRSLVIRHFNGALQTIPFSEVTSMINLSRDYSVCSVDLPVNYSASLEKVIDVCRRAFLKLKQSEDFGEKIIDDMNISGIDRFAEEGIHLAISFRTKPDPGRKISKALNKLIHDSMSSSDDFRPIQYLVNVPVSKKQGTT